ncbi:hypothetical protein MKQ70_14770 [Chitinophaga sedimenti]|uniref:hypothetical protein n=1 Tax=Chitinophaga sedimenti TaxID=2033606 RepID=UPI002002CDB9|nr:hypothetical protein [Chitinophaga sedimenti]MCK7556208.1 hypothetical protein [Chitinophaga sedimenti]
MRKALHVFAAAVMVTAGVLAVTPAKSQVVIPGRCGGTLVLDGPIASCVGASTNCSYNCPTGPENPETILT